MNPDPEWIARMSAIHAYEQRERVRKQGRLHRAAVERRKKRKRGGPK